MDPPAEKRLRPDERYCPHCKQIVAYKTYRAHKRLAYNPTTGLWFDSESLEHVPKIQDKVPVDDDESSPASSEESNLDCYEQSPPCSNPALSEAETSHTEDDNQQSDQEG